MFSVTVILITLFFSAFFSGLEIAFLSSNKLKIELDYKQKKFSAKIISKFTRSPSSFIAMLLVGNNVSLVVYGLFMARILEPQIDKILPDAIHTEFAVVTIQTFIASIIILFTAEYMPKALFRLNPNGLLSFFALPVLLIYYLLYPIVFIIIGISNFVLTRIFKVELIEGRPAFGKIDLDHYIRDISSKTTNETEHNTEIQMFQNALDFSQVKVRECMVPRTEIVALEVNADVELLRKKFIETGLSKILIYKESIDNVIGYIHTSEMFKHPKNISSILLPITIVTESMPANDLLSQFTKERKSLALVVDEFGGTSGMVTIEDIMEEIFGEIEDEHDLERWAEKKISSSEYLFSGRLEIDYLNTKYGLHLPASEDYTTIAGLILSRYESLPTADQTIVIPPFVITIIKMSGTRIEQVRLKVDEEQE